MGYNCQKDEKKELVLFQMSIEHCQDDNRSKKGTGHNFILNELNWPNLADRTFLQKGINLAQQMQKFSFKKILTLRERYRNFVEKSTHLAQKIQKIYQKQPMYSHA